jgi:hypothetical protein
MICYQKPQRITIPGEYVCTVDTYAYRNNGGEWKTQPCLVINSTKSLSVSLTLKTIIATPTTPKGATGYFKTVVWPKPTATAQEIKNICTFWKPQLCALIGDITIENPLTFMEKACQPEYQIVDDRPILVRDHLLKKPVLVEFANKVLPDGRTILTGRRIRRYHGQTI